MNQQQLDLFAALAHALSHRITVYRVIFEPGRAEPVATIFRGTRLVQPPTSTRSTDKETR